MSTATDQAVLTDLPKSGQIDAIPTEYPDMPKVHADPQTRGWYPNIEKYISSISDECIRYSKLHAETSKEYDQKNEIVTILVIILPFLVSVVGVVSVVSPGSFAATIITTILGLIGTLFGSLNKLMRFNEKAMLHRKSGNKYMKLNATVEQQILLPIQFRPSGLEFLQWCKTSFFNLKEVAPYPNKRLIEKSTKQHDIELDYHNPHQIIDIPENLSLNPDDQSENGDTSLPPANEGPFASSSLSNKANGKLIYELKRQQQNRRPVNFKGDVE